MGGVKQIAIGVNKMDCDVANYKQSRYDEIANEMKNMLIKVGWKKDFIEKNTPILPISGWMGDNLLKKSENMDWWKGMDVALKDETIHCDTVYHVLNDLVVCPRDPLPPPCGCRSLASTRSRASEMCSPGASSRVWSSPTKRWSSCLRTPPPILAWARSSPSRCITRGSTVRIQATTLG